MAHPQLISITNKNIELGTFAGLSAAHVIGSPIVSHPITLNLRPLLTPFRGAGRLFIRVERLPQQATLSAGKRNGDNSWTLASDELEDLHYFVPSHAARDHDLTIRVMSVEAGAATTLKVVVHPVLINGDKGAAVSAGALSQRVEQSRDPPLRNQLLQMQSLFAVRESEVRELRDLLECERAGRAADEVRIRSTLQTEFNCKAEALRAQHQRDLEVQHKLLHSRMLELTARLEAAEHQLHEDKRLKDELHSQCTLEVDRRWRASHEQQLSAERSRLEKQYQQCIADLRRDALTDSERALRSARVNWEQNMARVLLEAEERWKEEEQRRIAEISQRLQRQGELRLIAEKEKVAKLEALLPDGFATIGNGIGCSASASDSASLNNEVVAATRLPGDPNQEVRALRQELSEHFQRSRQEFNHALHNEREAWQQQEGVRRHKLVTELRKDSEAKLSALTFRCEEAEKALAHALRSKPDTESAGARPAYGTHRLPHSSNILVVGAPESEDGKGSGSSRLALLKEFVVVVCCVTPLVLLYPYLPLLKTFVVGVAPNSQSHSEVVPTPIKSPAAALGGPRMAVVTHGANVRQGPSIKTSVLFALKRGAKVEIVSKSEKWIEIKTFNQGAGARGWMLGSYVSAF